VLLGEIIALIGLAARDLAAVGRRDWIYRRSSWLPFMRGPGGTGQR
jgi:hypothetical protein